MIRYRLLSVIDDNFKLTLNVEQLIVKNSQNLSNQKQLKILRFNIKRLRHNDRNGLNTKTLTVYTYLISSAIDTIGVQVRTNFFL